ncbi:uncharacterized membrane protein YraQ (UPF0718 family) [Anoxybacillus tepidamans]|uniref:Uncharacterized membrane protein YraQ (UPF0718 family) n=1 Tax=Anoxybacteroides tepidamans TaxID=265948 RepID=A0A7W8IRK5_9BACL|nr:uncharacterized membrane protein YraQ (UPF0718 family) [Anoxybacillus tepidamans]
MKSFLQLNTIFVSILIESMPFVLIGVFISGIIQMFVTEEMVQKWCRKIKCRIYLFHCIGAIVSDYDA